MVDDLPIYVLSEYIRPKLMYIRPLKLHMNVCHYYLFIWHLFKVIYWAII